jgi:hypothetical protein
MLLYRSGQTAAQRLATMLAAFSENRDADERRLLGEVCHRAMTQDEQADMQGHGLADFYYLMFKAPDAPYGKMADGTLWKPTNVTGKAGNQL